MGTTTLEMELTAISLVKRAVKKLLQKPKNQEHLGICFSEVEVQRHDWDE